MIKNFCLLLASLLIIVACKKSDTSPVSNNYKMLTYSEYQNGGIDPYNVYHYIYDNNGNLIQTMTVNYGDTSWGRKYVYINNVLKYAYYPPTSLGWDTIFYFFGPGNRLDSITEHENQWSTINIKTSHFFYNQDNKVVFSLGHVLNNGYMGLADSMFYSYTGNNVTKIRWYAKYGPNPYDSTILILSYDNGRNYYKTRGLSAFSFYYWSDNNIVQMKNVQTSEILVSEYYTAYNNDEYPIAFRDTIGGVVPREVKITYKSDGD
jgi:hypothetical protein